MTHSTTLLHDPRVSTTRRHSTLPSIEDVQLAGDRRVTCLVHGLLRAELDPSCAVRVGEELKAFAIPRSTQLTYHLEGVDLVFCRERGRLQDEFTFVWDGMTCGPFTAAAFSHWVGRFEACVASIPHPVPHTSDGSRRIDPMKPIGTALPRRGPQPTTIP